ncbi:MAG: class I SAM-dependent methyltransferase [Butyrivibrio sp.]|nr:class I SAM-dependent methyltransferase [Butyrivibrio sp.]
MLDNKGFDLWADGYDKAVGLSEEADSFPFAGYKNVLGGIFQEIMTTENAKVLDIGFGTGTLATKLYENGCEIFGQDFSQRMIELAGEKMPNAKLYKGDIADGLVEPLREKKFDYIVGTYSFHHLSDEQKPDFIKELLDRLNDDGKILIGDVTFANRHELEECKKTAGDDWDDDESYFVLDELRESFPNVIFEPKSFCSGIIIISK